MSDSSRFQRMTDEHVAGMGDRLAYSAGWRAALAGKKLDFEIRKQKGDEKRHSFRCGFVAATQDTEVKKND